MTDEIHNDAPQPFLDAHPPHWAVRGTAWVLIAMFVTATLVALLVRIPESVSAPFVLVPIRGTDPVRAIDIGTITEVLVTEGDRVEKGAPLFVLQSREIGDRSAELGGLEIEGGREKLQSSQIKLENQRLADLQEEAKLRERSDFLTQMIEVKSKELALSRDMALTYERLLESGVSSRNELNDRQIEMSRVQLELQELQRDLAETSSALTKLRYETQTRQAESRLQSREITERMDADAVRSGALKKELTHSSGSELSVLAPCTGIVLRLKTRAQGAVVQEGDMLAEMVCGGETLQAELAVPQSGMSRLQPGQGVKLLYNAFPYQRFGVRFGTVRWVSPSSLEGDDGENFRVRVELASQSIRAGSQDHPLMPGMRGTARVVVERRTLISFALEPLRQLRESLRVPEAAPPATR